ncbi:phenylacetate--CoA ligase family protein [Deefgea piscis]|uniref:phenylacetate--CoA ligase family protein n=1 Tax=Deefgea piscis TaxID=2739061 RepID=UPI001C7F88BA|nr:hypothetical protein [Deefgea piscis]QZA82033.1 hypothetical protein K4H25_05120 [Deefgea piscis]
MSFLIKETAKYILRDNFITEARVSKLLQRESLDFEEHHRIIRSKLLATLVAAQKLPAYEYLSKFKLTEDNVIEVLAEIPIVSKADLVEKRQDYYPMKRIWYASGVTSGSTGSPLDVYRSLDSIVWENAFVKRHWRWFGFKDGMPRAVLRGDIVVPLEQSKPPFWRHNRLNNQLILSSRHLKPNFAPSMIEQLKNFSPYMLQAYPSSAYILAQYVRDLGMEIKIPFVFTSSEVLYSFQRDLIQEYLGSTVIDLYGMAERIAFASECEHGYLHVDPDYSYVEIVDKDGVATNDYGAVVGTALNNLAMPLVRYKLTDITRWISGSCLCGRTSRRIEPVQGRISDQIFDSHGNAVSTSLLTFIFKDPKFIREAQVAQIDCGFWQLRIVPYPGFDQAVIEHLKSNVAKHIDKNLEVDVICVEEIARTKAGKFKWIVNEIKG